MCLTILPLGIITMSHLAFKKIERPIKIKIKIKGKNALNN
jgi:hypothetical protein